MNTYEFTTEEVSLLQDAIRTYSERCAAQYNEHSKERIRKAWDFTRFSLVILLLT